MQKTITMLQDQNTRFSHDLLAGEDPSQSHNSPVGSS